MAHVKYTKQWLQTISSPHKHHLSVLVDKLERLVIPPCNCVGIIWYNQLRFRNDIKQIEQQIERFL